MDKPVWTIMKILNWTKQHFEAKGVENPRLDAEVLLCAVLKCERIKLYTEFDKPLSEEERDKMRSYVERRAKHEPLAYIIGERAFMRNNFKVTPATLVPRPETELLVESLVKAAPMLRADGAVKALDIGTGSGAIIISLLNYLPAAVGVGVDISNEALAVAKENASAIGVEKRVAFRQSDLFSNVPVEKSLISSFRIRRIFLLPILQRRRRMYSRSRALHLTAVRTDLIFIAASVPKRRSIWPKMACWRLKSASAKARLCKSCVWSMALPKLPCARTMQAYRAWFLR